MSSTPWKPGETWCRYLCQSNSFALGDHYCKSVKEQETNGLAMKLEKILSINDIFVAQLPLVFFPTFAWKNAISIVIISSNGVKWLLKEDVSSQT